jgi:hypothetical protein
MLTMEEIAQALRRSWTPDTAYRDTWRPDRRSTGQCAVTALVVQDYLGGTLRRAVLPGETHYWNVLPDGTEVDLTRDQFDSYNPTSIGEVTRDEIVAFPDTAHRYAILRESVAERLMTTAS